MWLMIWPALIGQGALGMLAVSQIPPAVPSEHTYTHYTVIGQFVILITTIAGFLYTLYRENRNRRWDLEDRRLRREDADRKAKALAEKVETARIDLVEKIDANTMVSQHAFEESNAVNAKIAELTRQFLEVKQHESKR